MGEERKNGTTMRGENMSKRMMRGEIKRGVLDGGKRGASKYKGGEKKVAYRRNKASYINIFIGLFVIFCAEPHQMEVHNV